jgi:hypothetical protein
VDEVHATDAVIVDEVVDVSAPDVEGHGDDDLRELTEALEVADELAVEDRLALLRRAEEAIAGSLEGLDGL